VLRVARLSTNYRSLHIKQGCTTYFTPSLEEEGLVHSQGVSPRVGTALFFPHGEGSGSLVHEGSALLKGTKYVLRTDVLYGKQKKK
jgi:hypothetical protein